MSDEIVVRAAQREDAEGAAVLIHATMGPLGEFLFGRGNPKQAVEVLARLFAGGSSRYSYQYGFVAVSGKAPVGLLIAYPGAVLAGLALPTARELSRVIGIRGLIGFGWRSRSLIAIREAERDEYFVNTIAVVPGSRRQGIGRRLLACAENEAHVRGLLKCSLSVEIDNRPAMALYESVGYHAVKTTLVPGLKRKIGERGFHRMVKLLGSSG
jgi:ribosomal protein S18 acetylase RimI-like enzyme